MGGWEDKLLCNYIRVRSKTQKNEERENEMACAQYYVQHNNKIFFNLHPNTHDVTLVQPLSHDQVNENIILRLSSI